MTAVPLTDADGKPVKAKPKRRPVPGLKLVVLRGGPPEWDGTVARVCDVDNPHGLERWDHIGDLALVWFPTGDEADVEVDRETKAGMVKETKRAQVYACAGYREDVGREGTAHTEGREVLAPGLWEDEADGEQEDSTA